MSRWIPIPQPALLLAAAAVAAAAIPGVHAPHRHAVEWIVSVALVVILFDGGLQIGRHAAQRSVVEIAALGIGGTLLTTVAIACFARLGFGFPWYVAALLAAAVAPTDPAVVFSVLGGREVEGRAGTILKGESGANDPVGIALMVSLVGAHHLSGSAAGGIAVRFVLQLGVGVVVGLLSGVLLRWLHERPPLAWRWLGPARAVLVIGLGYGLAAVSGGSGFLAVFLAGIILGDEERPPIRPLRHSFDWLSSAAEIVAFVVLGLTVDLHVVNDANVWHPALAIAAVLALVVRPGVVALCLLFGPLRTNERAFVAWAGLKGAVPILLGSLLLGARVAAPERFYSIIVVVVMISVVVQGGLIPVVARLLRIRLLPVS